MVDRLDPQNEHQLAAYVQMRANAIDQATVASEQVRLWQELHDNSYGDTSALNRDPTFNTIGWDSTYTGELSDTAEMLECVDNAVSRILAARPRRILEIGCGTGLLLYRLVPHCVDYVGTDLSARSIEQLRATRNRLDISGLNRTELRVQRADDFSDIAPGSFDTLVINSVVQYFPGVDYLIKVLSEAVQRCAPGGTIFIGDVRSLPLLRSYYGSVQWYRAEAGTTRSEFRRRIESQFAQEPELAIAPAFFHALVKHLPRLTSVAIKPKRGRIHNEMTRFRYDAVLRVEADPAPSACLDEISEDWRVTAPNAEAIRERLASTQPSYFGLRHVANARLATENRIAQWLAGDFGIDTVGDLRRAQERAPPGGIDPEALWDLANTTGYDVEIRCEPESSGGDLAGTVLTPRQPVC